MAYIIIWRARHRDPFVSTDTHDFLNTFSDYEEAKSHAEECLDNDGFHFDYQIFEEVSN